VERVRMVVAACGDIGEEGVVLEERFLHGGTSGW
jgi:hypothetical protein